MSCFKELDCSILINTCDSYSDIWSPFFTLFHKFWPDNPYPVFLNSESKSCSDANIIITTLKARESNLSWTRRYKEALERIDSDYIITILDDFFLYDYVDTKRVEECLTYMRKDPDMASIYFRWRNEKMQVSELPGMERCVDMEKWNVNTTLALWRKSTLLYYLDSDESPWEFESNAYARGANRNDKFYSMSMHFETIIPYNYAQYGLISGKWLRANIDLFEKNKIDCDFSVRSFFEEYEYGLFPYVARSIKMDSHLIPYYSLTKDNPRIDAAEIVEKGWFSQVYDVSGAKEAAVWYVSTFYGHVIEKFKCTILFESGEKEVLGPEDVWGSFSLYHDAMHFFTPGAKVYISTKSDMEMSLITIDGFLNKECDKDYLKAAYGMKTTGDSLSIARQEVTGKLFYENLLVPELLSFFRFYSKLCFFHNGIYDEQNVAFDGVDRFVGHFSQVYRMDQSADANVRWNIGATQVGFAIECLKVELVHPTKKNQFLLQNGIRGGNGIFVDGYWTFFGMDAHLFFKLPEEYPCEIRISGYMRFPIPRSIMRLVPLYDQITQQDTIIKQQGNQIERIYSSKSWKIGRGIIKMTSPILALFPRGALAKSK